MRLVLTMDNQYQMWWRLDVGEDFTPLVPRDPHYLRFIPGKDDSQYPGEHSFMDSFPPHRLDVESWETGWEVGMCVIADY